MVSIIVEWEVVCALSNGDNAAVMCSRCIIIIDGQKVFYMKLQYRVLFVFFNNGSKSTRDVTLCAFYMLAMLALYCVE